MGSHDVASNTSIGPWRTMVQTWAEKEMRNLIRLREAGMRVPQVVLLRSHVLVMGFIGEDGRAAPRLKDTALSNSKYCSLFSQLLVDVRRMYQAGGVLRTSIRPTLNRRKTEIRAVCEGERTWSSDGLGVGGSTPPLTESALPVCMSIRPEGRSCSDLAVECFAR